MSFIRFILSLFGLGVKSRTLKKTGQQIFAGLLAYSWSKQSAGNRRKFISACVEEGNTGVTFELMERMADWPRATEMPSDVGAAMREKVSKLSPWISDCKAAGLWARIIINNSNADVNKNLTSPAAFTQAADAIKKEHGEAGILILPVSERDSDLKDSFRNAIIAHCESIYSRQNTIAYADRRPDAAWFEKHMKDPGVPASGDWTLIAVSDTGDILRRLHDDGVTGSKPVYPAWENFVKNNLTAGVSVCCYAFHKEPNYVLLSKLGKVIKGAGK